MNTLIEPHFCNGCHTCYLVCPQKCINMVEDEEGFLNPIISLKNCIDCKMCIKRCPIKNKSTIKQKSKIVSLVAINKDDEIRRKSSSGGVFASIAYWIISQKGSVYGAAFDENFKVIHIKINNKEDISKLQGSKYVQSEIGDIFYEVKNDLEKGKKVLFTGTPCQVEGLKSFLSNDYENLYTQDIICHGVPSPKSWNKYIKEFKGNIKNISFRDKTYGWKRFSMKIETDSFDYINTLDKDIFLQSFLKNINLRKSCYNCKFKNISRTSDITLADFWGIENINKDYFDDKGTSLVILQTEKGEYLYKQVKQDFISSEVDLNEAIKYNSAINNSVKLTRGRKIFFNNINKYSYNELLFKSIKVNKLGKIKKFINRIYNKIKRVLKKLR